MTVGGQSVVGLLENGLCERWGAGVKETRRECLASCDVVIELEGGERVGDGDGMVTLCQRLLSVGLQVLGTRDERL